MASLQNKQFKSFDTALVKALDSQEGILEAIVSVFGVVDSYGERVMPGAFQKSLQRKLPPGVWMHDWSQPVAKTLEAAELLPGDPRLPESIREFGGLYVKAEFNLDTQRGRDAFSDVAKGIVDEFSIGYYLISSEKDPDGVLNLTEIDLAEWSPVLRGANPMTVPLAVRAAEEREGKDDLAQSGLRLYDHAASVRESVEALFERVRAVKALRESKGKTLGDRTKVELEKLIAAADEAKSLLTNGSDSGAALAMRLKLMKLWMEVNKTHESE